MNNNGHIDFLVSGHFSLIFLAQYDCHPNPIS